MTLEALSEIRQVNVATDGHIDSKLVRSFAVKFLDPELGDVPPLIADTTMLTGEVGIASILEVAKGSMCQ